jgi:hypothetical protein
MAWLIVGRRSRLEVYRHLSDASSVSLATVKRLEAKPGILVAHAPTIAALRGAFEAAGIEFTNGDQPGVRLRRKT